MKTLFDILKATFLTVSAIIGAGFITGRELVGYFGVQNFEVYSIFSGVLFFGCFLLIYSFGRAHNSYDNFNEKMLGKKGGKIMSTGVLISAFISLCSLFAAMDSLTESLGFFGKVPVFSIFMIVLVSFTSKHGVKGLEKINLVLVPVVLSAVVSALIFKGDFKFDFAFNFSALKGGKTVLYVTMNAFINLPIIFSATRGKNKKTVVGSAILSAIILSGLTFFMLGAIAFNGSGAKDADMPLLHAVGKGYSFVFGVALFTALISSVTTAYYPLYEFAVKTDGKRGIIILDIFAFAFSRIGLKNIVDYVYPVIGVFGLIYIIACIVYALKVRKNNKKISGIKKRFIEDNKRIKLKRRQV